MLTIWNLYSGGKVSVASSFSDYVNMTCIYIYSKPVWLEMPSLSTGSFKQALMHQHVLDSSPWTPVRRLTSENLYVNERRGKTTRISWMRRQSGPIRLSVQTNLEGGDKRPKTNTTSRQQSFILLVTTKHWIWAAECERCAWRETFLQAHLQRATAERMWN